jgi:hypothetical protein
MEKPTYYDEGIAINPETGEFDESLLTPEQLKEVRKMAAMMLPDGRQTKKKKGCNRKPKKKIKRPKQFGKNKKKK